MSEAVNAFLLIFATLFPVVNPLGTAPVFLSLTRDADRRTRHRLAGRVAINGFLLLLGSLVLGSYILTFFGITVPAVRTAGGLVVTVFGWQLLNRGERSPQAETARTVARHLGPRDAFYPLTMPLTVGPGSIAVAITLGSQRPVLPAEFGEIALLAAAAGLGLIAVAATIYISYRFADKIEDVLGETGSDVLVRLSAFILLCIGIQILWGGISGFAALLMH